MREKIKMINFILSILSGILYRCGGAGTQPDCWNWLRDTYIRDVGVSALLILCLLPSSCWLGLLLSFGLSWGILSCGYGGEGEPLEDQSFLYRYFGKFVFIVVGLGFGLALLPYAINMAVNGNPIWKVFGIGTILLTILIPVIHEFRIPILWWDSAQVEEFERGFVIIRTCLIF